MAVDPAKLCASWEVASGADKKRATSKQSFAQYCAHSEEQAEFFQEDFETIRKDVPRTHGKSFDNVELRELVKFKARATVRGDQESRVDQKTQNNFSVCLFRGESNAIFS